MLDRERSCKRLLSLLIQRRPFPGDESYLDFQLHPWRLKTDVRKQQRPAAAVIFPM